MIDTHLHIWDPSALDYGWLTEARGELYRRFGLTDAQAASEAAGAAVQGVILVQAADSIAESRYLLDQASDSDWVSGVVGWLPLREPDRVAQELERWAAQELVGIRHLTHDDPDPEFLLDPAVVRSLRRVADAGLTLDVPDSYPVQLGQVPGLAESVPGLRIIVDHLGKPPIGADLTQWRTLLRRAADHEQVVAKVSGLSTSRAPGTPWSMETLGPVLDHALEAFGPDRLMFGSDWPIAQPAGDYAAGTALLLDAVDRLAPRDREALLAGTARTVYGV